MKNILQLLFFPARKDDVLRNNELSQADFLTAAGHWPEFMNPGRRGLTFSAELGTPKFNEIMTFLEGCGKTASWVPYPSVPRNEYGRFNARGSREFTAEEIESATYLTVTPQKHIADNGWFTPDKGVTIHDTSIKKQPIGRVYFSAYYTVCTDTVKRKMEAQKFKGLEFKRAQITGKRPPGDPLWLLWASVLMPPLKNRLICQDGTPPVEGDGRRYVTDDPFFPILYRYDAAAVAALGELDVVMTHEDLGWDVGEHQLFASQRFRRWCIAQKFRIDWTPIALE